MYKVGDSVVVIGNKSNHNYKTGDEGTLDRQDGSRDYWCIKRKSNGSKGNWIGEYDFQSAFKTRKEVADYIENELLPSAEKEADELDKRIVKMRTTLRGLRKFKSDKAEAAHNISEMFKTGGEESAILKVLENMSAITKLDDNPSNVLDDLR